VGSALTDRTTESLSEIDKERLAAVDEGWGRLAGRYHLLDLGRTRLTTGTARWTLDSTAGTRPRKSHPNPMVLICYPRQRRRIH
jgi:hypothetical protein